MSIYDEYKTKILELLKKNKAKLNLSEIKDATGINYTAVSNIIKQMELTNEIKVEIQVKNNRVNKMVWV